MCWRIQGVVHETLIRELHIRLDRCLIEELKPWNGPRPCIMSEAGQSSTGNKANERAFWRELKLVRRQTYILESIQGIKAVMLT